jgi:poly(A) polymerase
LFFDPVENRVIDFVGGQADLQKRIIRAIGDPEARFSEDHLRLLRALRFAARLEFEIEPATAAAIQHHARYLARISPERIAEELRLMLTRFNANWGWFKMLTEFSGLADVIFRFAGDPPPPERREVRIFEYLASGETVPFALSLAEISLNWAMLQHTDRNVSELLEPSNIQQMVRALRQSLRISNEEVDQMTGTLEGTAILLNKRPMPIAVAKRFLARDTAAMSRRLLADLVCLVGKLVLQEANQLLDELSTTDFAPPPLVTGDDLTAQGLQPGKLFKRILDETYDAQLEDRVRDKTQALAFAMQIAGKP